MTIFHHPESDALFAVPNPPFQSELWEHCSTVDPTTLLSGVVISTSMGRPSVVLPSMDLETYSEAGYLFEETDKGPSDKWVAPYKVKGVGPQGKGSLPVVGTAAYAEHPSTEVLSLVYDLKDGKGRRRWVPGTPDPVDLLYHIASGGLMEAWNITFEFFIWNLVLVPKYRWPYLRRSQCRCAMAKARRYSVPGALDGSAKVLGTPRKDAKGTALITKLTRPHTPTKNRPEKRWTTATAWPDFLDLYAYNDGDVIAEDHASAHIPDLTPYELEIWQFDQTVNIRGVQVDEEAVKAALVILRHAEVKYTKELAQITGGKVNSVSEVQNFGDWISSCGINMDNLKKDTVEAKLEQLAQALGLEPVPEDAHPVRREIVAQLKANPHISAVHRALEIRQLLGSANVKKLRKLHHQVSRDGRLRNQYMYCGADRTGRWSSAAADNGASNSQLQNITAKGPKTAKCESCHQIFGSAANPDQCPRCGSWMFAQLPEWTIEGVRQAIADIKQCAPLGEQGFATFEGWWGAPIDVLCGCLRGLFIPKPRHMFICCDFSAIEAVVAACLARCQWRIDVFATHGKIYEQSAANAIGVTLEEILDYKKKHGVHHPARKGVGKIRELAGGYGGWIGAWKNFGAEDYYDDDEAIKADVLKWRAESPEIVEAWGGQWRWCGPGKWDFRPELFGIEGCVINAIQNPGKCFSHYDLTYGVTDDILFCRLPSGRFLQYHKPRLTPTIDRLSRAALQISFEGHNSNSQKGPIGWVRQETYGARLFENAVQAVSCDVQAEALVRCEKRNYHIVMHTHDEGCAEVPEGFGSVEEMVSIMCERPSWASWWPIKAAGWKDDRYQKD